MYLERYDIYLAKKYVMSAYIYKLRNVFISVGEESPDTANFAYAKRSCKIGSDNG